MDLHTYGAPSRGDGVSGGGTPPLPDAPPPAATQPFAGPAATAHLLTAQQRLVRRAEIVIVAWSLLIQGYAYAQTARALTCSQHLGQLFLGVTRLGALLFAHALPVAQWWRLRAWIITAARLAIGWQLAHTEEAQRGMCVMLQRAAEAGALGALKDGLRIAYGTRILAQVLTVLALGCPPLAVLLQQVCMLVLLPQPAALCASPLLADPLTRSRMGQAWFMLDLMPLPPSIGMLARPDAQNASASAGQGLLACVRVVRYAQIVAGVMLPVAVSGLLAHLQQQARGQTGRSLTAARTAGRRRQRHWSSTAGAAAALRRIAAQADAAWAWLDAGLANCCGC